MSQISLDEFRQQLAKFFEEAKASGYAPEEIMPDEIQETQKQMAEDYKQLQVDHQLLKRQADFYQIMMGQADKRAADYMKRWKDATSQQNANTETEKKLASLESENDQLKAALMKLVEENRDVRDLYADFKEQAEEAWTKKNYQLLDMERYANKCEDECKKLEKELDLLEKTYDGLVQRLENENGDTAAAVNAAAERIRKAEKVKNATVSEMRIVHRCYELHLRSIGLLQNAVHQLFDEKSSKVGWSIEELGVALSAAKLECQTFHTMREAMQAEGLEEDDIRKLLGEMVSLANQAYDALVEITVDMDQFMATLADKPNTAWAVVKSKFAARK
jgi:chromosome segregation ATPase